MDEIYSFFCFLYYIEDVDLALNFYNIAGAAIDAELLKRVARKVTGCHISDHVVDIVITLFDDNQVIFILNNVYYHMFIIIIMNR